MNRSYRLARAPEVRRPWPPPVVLLVLLAQVAACQPDPTPEPDGSSPEQTSPYSLSPSVQDPDSGTAPPESNMFRGVLTTHSALGILDFRYDAYVLTAQQSGTVTIKSNVIEARPGGYPFGYGYPLSMAAIEDGLSLSAYGGSYVQNALDTGTAIITYPVLAGHQYILVYKTFGSFTPLTYRLTMPSTLTLEGQIDAPAEPVSVPQNSAGRITLENPRPDALSHYVPWLSERVSKN